MDKSPLPSNPLEDHTIEHDKDPVTAEPQSDNLSTPVEYPIQFQGWKNGVLRYANDTITLTSSEGVEIFSLPMSAVKEVKRQAIFLHISTYSKQPRNIAFGDVNTFMLSQDPMALMSGSIAGITRLPATNPQVAMDAQAGLLMDPWIRLFRVRGVFKEGDLFSKLLQLNKSTRIVAFVVVGIIVLIGVIVSLFPGL